MPDYLHTAIDGALVVGLHARREHFDEEALEVGVDNFNLALIPCSSLFEIIFLLTYSLDSYNSLASFSSSNPLFFSNFLTNSLFRNLSSLLL